MLLSLVSLQNPSIIIIVIAIISIIIIIIIIIITILFLLSLSLLLFFKIVEFIILLFIPFFHRGRIVFDFSHGPSRTARA